MNELTDANEQALLNACGAVDVDPGSYDRHELKVVPGGKTISNPTTSMDIDRDIGNFFYDLKPTRDAGVGLTEQNHRLYRRCEGRAGLDTRVPQKCLPRL